MKEEAVRRHSGHLRGAAANLENMEVEALATAPAEREKDMVAEVRVYISKRPDLGIGRRRVNVNCECCR